MTGDSTQYAGQKNPWIAILNLDEKNVETIETAISEEIIEGTNSKLFVFTPDGRVRYFRMYTPDKTSNRKRRVKEKNLSRKDQDRFIKLLKDMRADNFMNVRANQLNITSDNGRYVKVASARTYRFRYIGYDYYKDFSTYAPRRYIQSRIPGWQERQKMIRLFSLFNIDKW